MASSPLLRKSHSDRCAKRDPRARRDRQMITRADMQIFRQTVPPLRRSRSDRCARRDPRARRGSPMIRRADMRVGRPFHRCGGRRATDARSATLARMRATKGPVAQRCAFPLLKGLRGGGRKEGITLGRKRGRVGGLGDEQRERAPEHPTPNNPVGGVGCVRAFLISTLSLSLSLRSERRFRLPSGSERLRVGAFSGVPDALRRRARVSSPASERCGRRATPSSPSA